MSNSSLTGVPRSPQRLRGGPLFIAGAVALHVALAAPLLVRDALWLDEMMSLQVVQGTAAQAVAFFRGLPEQHPVYYILLRMWLVAGGSDAWIRGFSLLASIGSLILTTVAVRRAFGDRQAAVTAVLYAVSPFAIYFAREARMYPLLSLVTVASALELQRVLEDSGRSTWRLWLLYVVGLYTHFFFSFALFAQACWVLYRQRRQIRPAVAAATVAAGLCYVPWALLILGSPSVSGQAWKGPGHLLWGVPYALFRLAFGYTVVPPVFDWKSTVVSSLLHDWWAVGAILAGVAASVGGLWSVRRERREAVTRFAAFAAIPFLCSLVISLKVIMVGDRYFAVSFPFLAGLMAVGIVRALDVASSTRFVSRGALVLAGASLAMLLYREQTDPRFGTPQWKAVATDIDQRLGEGGRVYVHLAYERPLLERYLPARRKAQVSGWMPDDASHDEALRSGAMFLVVAGEREPDQFFRSLPRTLVVRECTLYPRDGGLFVLRIEAATESEGTGPVLPTCRRTLQSA